MAEADQKDRLLAEGVAAVRAGNRATARQKLTQLTQLDPYHEQGWLWLSAAVDTDAERITCLENVLSINPDNDTARRGLEKLREQQSPASPMPPPAPPMPYPPMTRGRAAQPDPPDTEAWRKPQIEAPAETAAMEAAPRSILDLFDVWVAALTFRLRGPYHDEIESADMGHMLVNLVAVAILSAISAVLVFNLVLLPVGGLAGYMQSLYSTAGVTLDATTTRQFTQLANGLGVALPFMALLGVLIGEPLYGVLLHVSGKVLGGKGELMQTLNAVSLAYVAQAIAQLIPLALTVIILFVSGSASATLSIYNLLSVLISLYGLALIVAALSTAHQFGILRAIGTLLVSVLLTSAVACCLAFALGALSTVGR